MIQESNDDCISDMEVKIILMHAIVDKSFCGGIKKAPCREYLNKPTQRFSQLDGVFPMKVTLPTLESELKKAN